MVLLNVTTFLHSAGPPRLDLWRSGVFNTDRSGLVPKTTPQAWPPLGSFALACLNDKWLALTADDAAGGTDEDRRLILGHWCASDGWKVLVVRLLSLGPCRKSVLRKWDIDVKGFIFDADDADRESTKTDVQQLVNEVTC